MSSGVTKEQGSTVKSTSSRRAGILATALRSCKFALASSLPIGALVACSPDLTPPERQNTPPAMLVDASTPGYTGADVCVSCHEGAGAAWRGSDHDLAMQPATPETMLGQFGGEALTLGGVAWEFTVVDDAFRVTTTEPAGETEEHEITHTFGFFPLQQYLVPMEGGRLQTLPVAWDSRPETEGGQRWFHLYDGAQLRAGDPLHWQGRIQTWNHQCADCHSTALERGYDEAADAYDTTWHALDVSCEACHGPGSEHVRWARAAPDTPQGEPYGLQAPLRRAPGSWQLSPGQAIARRSHPPEHAEAEIATCAPCHSRRARIQGAPLPGEPFLDGYLPALLDEGLYFANGRMRDEVYVWGSFQQSRMHAAGVTCSDCHEPHSLEVRGGPDEVCSNCHLPAAFATPEHHGHPADSAGARCVACHMPERTYMGVDARRDHSLQVPRPDVAARTGSPSVCLDCHPGRDAQWATDALAQRGALRTTPAAADAIADAWRGAPGAGAALAAFLDDPEQAPIVRATSAALLGGRLTRETLPALRSALSDPKPLVRLGGVYALDALAPTDRLALGRDRLQDPIRAVRIEAARSLAAVPPGGWDPKDRVALARALAEYREAQELSLDQPEAQLNLSQLESRMGDLDAALRRAQAAADLAPDSPVPWIHLADVQRERGEEEAAEATLRRGLTSAPRAADLHLALGFALVRQGRSADALGALADAFALSPESNRIAYAYALALNGAGSTGEAITILEQAIQRAPQDRQLLVALVTFERDRGDVAAAIRWADTLAAQDPMDSAAQSLRRSLTTSRANP